MGRMTTVLFLVLSNTFMTYAWYGHLKDFKHRTIFFAIIVSWSIAFFEYCLQVPANRIGYQYYSLGQLKVIQEIVTMAVFAVFSVVYMKQDLKLDYLWAGICLIAASYFMFRGASIQSAG